MPTCVTRNAGGENRMTVFACPSYPLSYLLVNPSHRKTALATLSVTVSNLLGWGTDLSLVMGIFISWFHNVLVLVGERCGTIGSGSEIVFQTSRQKRYAAERSGHGVEPCTAGM
jgi:hypothetical protein